MQLVYFNDLHKNLGCNSGITSEFSIIPALFTVLPVNFFALPFSSASFFSRALSHPASNCLVRTDISIAQKTCEFRPVDISVPAAKRNKLIYQFAYALPEALAGLNSLSQSLTALPASSGREPLARPQALCFNREVPTCRKRAKTLRWARGREGCSESPLPTSGLHPPRNGPRAARP